MQQTIPVKDKQHAPGPGIAEYIIIVALFAMGVTGVFTALYGTVRNHHSEMILGMSDNSTATQRHNITTDEADPLSQDNGLVSYSKIVY